MNRRSILSVSATVALGLALFGITAGSTARAAEIRLLCAVALQPAMVALIPDFEKSSGHKVTIAYGTAEQRVLSPTVFKRVRLPIS